MLSATNTPYVKQFEDRTVQVEKKIFTKGKKGDGITNELVDVVKPVLINPITKENPYKNDGSNRRTRRVKKQRFQINRKGTRLVVHQSNRGAFAYKPRLQMIGDKTILHYDKK